MKRKIGTLFDVLSKILFVILCVIALNLMFFLVQSRTDNTGPSIFGYKAYIVMSGSMSPAIETGALVFVVPVSPSAVKPGDIISFGNSGRITTHRVVAIDRQDDIYFITKGDANDVQDPNPVNSRHLIGKVVCEIPYLGFIFYFARTKNGMIAVLLILISMAVIELTKQRYIKNDQKKDKKN